MTLSSGDGERVRESHGAVQRRQITALFCDLVGSTQLAGRLDPEDFREVLDLYHRLAGEAIERYGGYTAQFLGDGVVACFGYPRAHEDDAERAVYASLALIAGLDEVNATLRPRFGVTLQVRIGCHTGLVVAGAREAAPGRDEFAMVGETPHVAARLQGVAEPGSVVVSDATEALIRARFETEPLGARELAGVAVPVGVHRVLRSSAETRLDPAAAERLPRLVGRNVEMETLMVAWRGTEQGRGALVELSGEPGIGKSRLVQALAERLGDELGAAQRWQCSRHHQTTMLYPVIRLLEGRFALERGEDERAQVERVRAALAEADLDPDDATPRLADLLALGNGAARRERPGDAQEERTALLRTLQSLLVADRAAHPLLLVIEDLQWADPTTIELLWRVVNALRELPVLCVITHRQDFSWPWRREPGAQIELGPLADEQVRELAGAVTDAALDERVLERVCAAADGVPLFVEEMLKTLALADADAEEAVITATAERSVPATLHGLLAERLDRLSDLGDVLDVAAVLGREFDRELLAALGPIGTDVGPALDQLAVCEVVRPVDEHRVRWEFRHALLHDAAYSRILRRRRQQLHGLVASTLVERFPERVEREPEVVAHHFACAAAPDEAARYWHAAGIRALERAAFVEAAEHFRSGLAALERAEPEPGGEERRADFETHLGAALQAGHGYAAAGVDAAYASARAIWQRTGDDERLAAVVRGQWMLHLVAADYGAAYELAEQMLGLPSDGEGGSASGEGHLYAGMVHMYRGELERAREHLAQALQSSRRPERVTAVYEAQGDTVAAAHAYLASVLCELGAERESREHSDRSLELAERIDRPVTRAQAWFMRAILHLVCSEPREFGEWIARAHAYSADRNIRYWRTIASAYSNWGRAAAGDRLPGIERLQASIESYRESGARLGLVHLYVLLADLLAPDAPGAALETVALAQAQVARSGERLSEAELHRCRARMHLSGPRPDPAAAVAELQLAAAVAGRIGARLQELRALGQLVGYQRREGVSAPAAELRLAELCDRFAPDSQLPDVVRARAALALAVSGS